MEYALAVIELPLVDNGREITLSDETIAANFEEVGFVPRTAGHEVTQVAEGYEHKLQCRVLRHREAIRDFVETYRYRQMSVLYKTTNGEWKLVNNLKLKLAGSTGEHASDANAVNLMWTGEVPHMGISVVVS